MARFKILAGIHTQADKSQEPAEVKDPVTGKVTQKWPSRTYKQGEVVESDVDLVAKHGAEKFQLVGGQPEHYDAPPQAAVFPGGQVSSGIQGGEAAEAKRLAEGRDAGVEDTRFDDNPERRLTPQESADREKARAELNKKSYAELVDLARKEKVDLKGATKKEEVVKAILAK